MMDGTAVQRVYFLDMGRAWVLTAYICRCGTGTRTALTDGVLKVDYKKKGKISSAAGGARRWLSSKGDGEEVKRRGKGEGRKRGGNVTQFYYD
jgi:hypothetical protein